MNTKDILEKAKKSIDEFLTSSKSTLRDLQEKFKNKFQTKNAADNQTQATADSDTTKNDSAVQSKKEPKQIGLTIVLSLLDIMASLVFIAAIVIAIKPSLLEGKLTAPDASYSTVVKKVGNIILKIEATRIPATTAAQMFFVGLGLIIFGVLKAFVLLVAKSGTKKIVSALTLVMTYFACFMISDKFLLFTIFILLLYFTFDYSCGFSTPVVLVKLGIVIISAIIIYVAVHFAIKPNLREAVKDIYEALRLPILRWW